MTTVAGIDLLTIPPNLGASRTSTVDRDAETVAMPTGVVLETTTAPATATHALEWGCATRADLAAVEAVLDARQGRRVPIWIPTYQRDVSVQFSNVTGWIVPKRPDGADLGSLVASDPAWQWWISRTAAEYRVFHLTSVTDLGDGTESWNGSPPVGTAPLSLTSATGGVFSRLCFCRMAEDSYRVRYLALASVVSASFIEVPAEAP